MTGSGPAEDPPALAVPVPATVDGPVAVPRAGEPAPEGSGDAGIGHGAPPGSKGRVAVLGSAQLVAGIGVASAVSVGGLLAEAISGTAAYAGLPQTGSVLGAALMAVPLARLAGRAGRRPALALGFALAAVGAGVALTSAAVESLVLLVLGCLLVGAGMAAGLQARFAATDGVADRHRGVVLSIVVWASSIGAILGPNLIEPGAALGTRLGILPLGGPWIFACVALLIAAGVVLVGLRGTRPATPPAKRRILDTVRATWAHPSGRLGLVAMATGHAVMVGVMAMSSVHLHGHGSSLRFIGLVISAHVAGMYLLAPVFGWLADRRGAGWVVGLGAVTLLVGCAGTAASGWVDAGHGSHRTAEALATAGLVLIGLGWSAVTVAAATLIAVLSHHGRAAPTDVQGVADLTMGLAGATAGILSGVALAGLGYAGLSAAGAILLLPLVALLASGRRARRRGDAAGEPAKV
ncbi:MFS transporter [Demequina sp. NBRC 110056]|uniref:MFS transporter n=1 Tax=Demequina sp. NBRC 110056 TaxID=1570345 RepID=UPI00190E75B4|nr:MFS transporter [Demequina sp. NBRC 110056]